MLHHGRKGDITIEVMGYLRGKVIDNTVWVTDAYALPVEGTETRVNAGSEALEYQGKYEDLNEIIKKQEGVVGWYHTHPNYGPWLQGIDVNTQRLMQQVQDPFIAIVLDPIRTHISGMVDIGAFRVCEEKDHPGWGQGGDVIPEDKIKDFGLQYKKYYKLDTTFYMNQKDNEIIEHCWSQFWKSILESDAMNVYKEHYASTLGDLAKKSNGLVHDMSQQMINPDDCGCKLDHYIKFQKEINQATNQDCIKGLAFN